MNRFDEYQKLKREHDTLAADEARAGAMLDHARTQAQEEFGTSDVDALRALTKKMKKELARLEQKHEQCVTGFTATQERLDTEEDV